MTRWLAAGFGILQIAIGIWATTFSRSVVGNALSIAGYAAGLLLGLFALGVLTRNVRQNSALFGAAGGLFVLLFFQFGLPALTDDVRVAWPWYALIGSTATFAFGNVAARLSSIRSRSES